MLALVVVLMVVLVASLAAGGLGGCRQLRLLDLYTPVPEEEDRHRHLYRLLDAVGGALQRREIPYWAMGGTLLGAVRHGGMIPWDDDIDIGVWAHDLPRVHLAVANDLGDWTEWRRELRSWVVSEIGRPDVALDVFPSATIDEAVRFDNPHARKKWAREYLTPDEFGVPTHVSYGPTTVPLVARPCSYLDRVYPQWDRHGKVVRHYQPVGGSASADASMVVEFDPAESRSMCEEDPPYAATSHMSAQA